MRRRGPGVLANTLRLPLYRSKGGDHRASHVPGEPHCACALLSDPGGTDVSGHYDTSTRPPCGPRRRLLRATCPSGLNHTAWALAIYASQCPSPGHHARLASGCRASSTGRDWLPARFHRKVLEFRPMSSCPPFPSFRGIRAVTESAGQAGTDQYRDSHGVIRWSARHRGRSFTRAVLTR